MGIKKPPLAPSAVYWERLLYARWIRQLTDVAIEDSDTALWKRAGVTQSWFSKWKESDETPPGHRELAPLAKALGVSFEWLSGQEGGVAPLPTLFWDWIAARRGNPIKASDPRYMPMKPGTVVAGRGENAAKES